MKVIAPVDPEFRVNTCDPAVVPLIVVVLPEKLIAAPAGVPALFVVSIATAAPNVTGPIIVTTPPLVVMLPSRVMAEPV